MKPLFIQVSPLSSLRKDIFRYLLILINYTNNAAGGALLEKMKKMEK